MYSSNSSEKATNILPLQCVNKYNKILHYPSIRLQMCQGSIGGVNVSSVHSPLYAISVSASKTVIPTENHGPYFYELDLLNFKFHENRNVGNAGKLYNLIT